MLKVSAFHGRTEQGPTVIPLFGPADGVFEKLAAPSLVPEIVRYISALRPRDDAQYNLVNAMGAGEYYGSNINGDYFDEVSLIHSPDGWTGNPLVDKVRAKNWPYGFPTFYYAHPYAHHRNKDSSRAFGEVELALWNPHMKRVELITRVDKELCQKYGGTGVWDKLKAGEFPDVSMGCKVPFDTCSICLDWETYRKAQATFDPHRHKHPGEAVLAFHKKLKAQNGKGIRGLSITRKDYCDHALHFMNRILSDGRKVFVRNDYPRFFDISFVFIGADKTAKVMMKVAESGKTYWFVSGAELAEKLGYDHSGELLESVFIPTPELEKAAEAGDPLEHAFLGKQAKEKDSEIEKHVVPSQFAGKAVPALTKNEPHIDDALLDQMSRLPLEQALSTPTGMGIILRPREFQRIILIQLGQRDVADGLDARGEVFRESKETEPMDMGPEFFHPALARLLAPLLADRSMLGPFIEKRVVVLSSSSPEKKKSSSSLSSDLLHKIGAAYNGYRNGVMDLVANAQTLAASAAFSGNGALSKVASAPVHEVFTPLSAAYIRNAFLDEVAQ